MARKDDRLGTGFRALARIIADRCLAEAETSNTAPTAHGDGEPDSLHEAAELADDLGSSTAPLRSAADRSGE